MLPCCQSETGTGPEVQEPKVTNVKKYYKPKPGVPDVLRKQMSAAGKKAAAKLSFQDRSRGGKHAWQRRLERARELAKELEKKMEGKDGQ